MAVRNGSDRVALRPAKAGNYILPRGKYRVTLNLRLPFQEARHVIKIGPLRHANPRKVDDVLQHALVVGAPIVPNPMRFARVALGVIQPFVYVIDARIHLLEQRRALPLVPVCHDRELLISGTLYQSVHQLRRHFYGRISKHLQFRAHVHATQHTRRKV